MKLFKKSHKRKTPIPNRKAIHLKKKLLVACCIVGVIVLLVAGTFAFVQYLQPLYVSPIPFPFSQVTSAVQSADAKTIEKALIRQQIEYADVVQGENDTYQIILKGNGSVILSGKKDISSQVSSLQVILTRLTMEGKQFKSLDMRFNKPVVVFK